MHYYEQQNSFSCPCARAGEIIAHYYYYYYYWYYTLMMMLDA